MATENISTNPSLVHVEFYSEERDLYPIHPNEAGEYVIPVQPHRVYRVLEEKPEAVCQFGPGTPAYPMEARYVSPVSGNSEPVCCGCPFLCHSPGLAGTIPVAPGSAAPARKPPRGETMSNALCNVGKAQAKSLPHSLRHHSQEDALCDAVRLVKMLDEVFYMCECTKDQDLDSNAFPGLRLVFDLLRDKIEIGMGDYKFPLCTIKNDEPALAEREGFVS